MRVVCLALHCLRDDADEFAAVGADGEDVVLCARLGYLDAIDFHVAFSLLPGLRHRVNDSLIVSSGIPVLDTQFLNLARRRGVRLGLREALLELLGGGEVCTSVGEEDGREGGVGLGGVGRVCGEEEGDGCGSGGVGFGWVVGGAGLGG